ncbi:hypothetical protein Egran_02073 [Elaphomyces granulatus]|uniref:RING-type domain-containing protein n=2 Tax=Elaphomyces granulatus TaxID=519963 RepID=A0A232M1C9_9EURO|nr:hypothetical protein Egran_02073 [Elaphomyces granulatus]
MAQASDSYLRCNNLKCRTPLDDRAVITTCSHIFCLQCAPHTGLSRHVTQDRHCPACHASLLNDDDTFSVVLNPTEEHKNTVLCGLDPNTILECVARALSFWSYQTTQETIYQEYLNKSLTDKYRALEVQMDNMATDANSKITNLQNQLSEMRLNQEQLHKKNHDLISMYKDKCKKFTQVSNLYNILKSRALRSQMETAASDSVANTINSLRSSRHTAPPPILPPEHNQYQQLHRQRSGSGGSKDARRKCDSVQMPPPPNQFNPMLQGAGPTSRHRTQLPGPPRTVTRPHHDWLRNSTPSSLFIDGSVGSRYADALLG